MPGERAGVTAEPLHRILTSLRHDLDGADQNGHRQNDQYKRDDIHALLPKPLQEL